MYAKRLSLDANSGAASRFLYGCTEALSTIQVHKFLFIYLLCHIYPGVPHQCAALFSLGLLQYMHDKNKHQSAYIYIYSIILYNSVLTRRHIHINSSASTPPNATKIAEMKNSHHGQVIVGPELLCSIYKINVVFWSLDIDIDRYR